MASFRPFPYRKEGIGRNVYRSYGFGSRGYGVNDDISSRRSHFYPRRSHEHHSVGGPGCYGFSKLARGYDYAICDDCGHRRALIEAGRHCFEEAQEYICCEPRCYNYQDYWDHDGGYGGCRERYASFLKTSYITMH